MYIFPEIRTIDDVLPHIADRPEIIVVDKIDYTVINYVVVSPELFGPVVDTKSAILRECRGLIFNKDGKLISRPFHKFFNVGEREETLPQNIDFSHHTVYDKLDGSMIRPLALEGDFYLATKMGITDASMQCTEWLKSDARRHAGYIEVLKFCCEHDYTPIFEWISPDNRIVVSYTEPALVLLAVRDNLSGVYHEYDNLKLFEKYTGVPVVKRYESFDSISDFITRTKGETGNEGYIIELNDGNRVKIKTDEYSRIHKIKEKVQQDRHIIALILDEQLDDAKAGLTDYDLNRVEKIEKEYFQNWNRKFDEINSTWETIREIHDTAKDFAINNVMTGPMRSMMFSKFSGKDTRNLLNDLIRKNLGQDKKYQDFLNEFFTK